VQNTVGIIFAASSVVGRRRGARYFNRTVVSALDGQP